MGEKVFHPVASGIDVELMPYLQRVEFPMQICRPLIETETVLTATIEVNLESSYPCGVSPGQNKGAVLIPEGGINGISKKRADHSRERRPLTWPVV